MCLTNCYLVHKDEPIKCYKVLIQNGAWYKRKYFTAPFRTNFNYEIGEIHNENKRSFYNEFLNIIEDGYFHSFKNLEDCYTFIDVFPKSDFKKHQKLVIAECEIPKDAACYEGAYSYWAYSVNGIPAHPAYASKSITVKRLIKK